MTTKACPKDVWIALKPKNATKIIVNTIGKFLQEDERREFKDNLGIKMCL
ncbi:MAG TPA: hypothetical protein VK566_04245 [Nitrososphaeraceae archaeon]|nr:hypothetical protein [Nitrososphaeraceae archaeon]